MSLELGLLFNDYVPLSLNTCTSLVTDKEDQMHIHKIYIVTYVNVNCAYISYLNEHTCIIYMYNVVYHYNIMACSPLLSLQIQYKIVLCYLKKELYNNVLK